MLLLAGALALATARTDNHTADRRADDEFANSAGVPVPQVARIHAALHEMGAQCTSQPARAAVQRISDDVDVLIGFAHRHPQSRFTIDGENGRSPDLLPIAATEMHGCAPAAARAAHAPPANVRPSTTPTAS